MATGCLGSQSTPESSGGEDSRTSSPEADSSVALSPAPETVHVRAAFLSCAEDEAPVACRIHIDEVLGYGSATPPVGTGERSIHVPRVALSESHSLSELLSVPPQHLVLHHDDPQLQLPNNGQESGPRWRLVSIGTPESDG